jgi:hypothetical protein
MIDITTKQPLFVSIDGIAGPYLMLPVAQVDEVRRILNQHRIPHSVDDAAISLNGSPAVTVIDFGRSADANCVQQILDSIP